MSWRASYHLLLLLLLLQLPRNGAINFLGSVTAIPSPSQLRWHAYEVGSMTTWNLQALCVPCGHPNATAQRCQAFGCLPAWRVVQAWAMASLNVSAWLAASASFGARYSVLVADHMSGFALWPTRVHNVSIAATAYKGGGGDVVAEFRAAAAAQGIAAGLFYSTHYNWALGVDGYRAGAVPRAYGGPPLDQAQFEDAALAQLAELRAYESDGRPPWAELWFDGGVDTVLTPRVGPFVRAAFPSAVCHSCLNFTQAAPGVGVGVRWMGNEEGQMPLPSWGASPPVNAGGGDHTAALYIPPSCDTVLEEHFCFCQPVDVAKLRSTCALINVYLTSVGRASNLILNLAPGPSGALQPEEVAAYRALGEGVRCLWRAPLAAWGAVGVDLATGVAALPLPAPLPCPAVGGCVLTLVLQEDIGAAGQRVGAWAVEARVGGAWAPAFAPANLNASVGLGHKRIVALRVAAGFDALRLVVATAYTAAGDAAAPISLAAAALFDRAATADCLPAGCCECGAPAPAPEGALFMHRHRTNPKPPHHPTRKKQRLWTFKA
jgi:alpha-L-fucosidase